MALQQQINLDAPTFLESSEELNLGVYYKISETGSTELAGIGAILLFDATQLEFIRYEKVLSTDLFQIPTKAFTEKELYESLISAGKTVNADLDSVPATASGIPFAYLSGSDQLFDGKEETKWDGIVRWPGANTEEAKTNPGIKLFSLVFKPTVNFKDTIISSLVTTTAEGYTGGNGTSSIKINKPSIVTGAISQSGTEDSTIAGTLKLEDEAGILNVSIIKEDEAKSGVAKLKLGNQQTPLSSIGKGASIEWEYKPNENFNGKDSFVLSITDNFQKTTKQKIELGISAVDDAATVTGNFSGSAQTNESITGKLTASDIEGLTDRTIFSIGSKDIPQNGISTVDPETGTWRYVPNKDFSGNDKFTITITDDLGGTSTQSINVNINKIDETSSPMDLKILNKLDGITNNPKPTVIGKAQPNAKVEIFQDSVAYGNTTADQDGFWSIPLLKSLKEGSQELKAYAKLEGRLISKASTPLLLVLDTIMPTLTIGAKNSAGNTITNLYAGETAILRFKFSEETKAQSFTKEDVIAISGTEVLGAITEFKKDSTDPTLFTAILTPGINLISSGSISVKAGTVEDLGGNVNVETSIPFTIHTGASYSINNGLTGDSAPLIQQEGTGSSETTYTFKVSRNGDTRAAGDVSWKVVGNESATSVGRASEADFTDGKLQSGTISFSANDTETKTITVKVKQDAIFEIDEIFRVELSSPTSANTNITANLAPGKAVVSSIIINDDAPPLRPVVNNPIGLIGLTDLRGETNQATLQGSSPDFDLNLAASLQSTGIKNGDSPVELSFSPVDNGLTISGKLGTDSSSNNHPFSALFRAETKAAATAPVSSDRIGADDVDIIPFSVAQTGAYQLSTRNQGDSTEQSKPTIRLFKADGTELTNGKIAAPAQGLSEQQILTLAAGNYYAVILPTGAATKNFALDSNTTATGFQPGFSAALSNTELQEFNRSTGSYLFEIKAPKLETSAPAKIGTSAKVDLSTPVNSGSINVSGANKSAVMVRTVAGIETEIKGSVIVDPITNELSFVPTKPLDMAKTGKYEFRLITSDLKITDGSGALVMDPAANNALQGDPGSNVSLAASTTVKGDLGTIINGETVKLLYLPSFARGLGQSVDLEGGTGIPISITNADDLRSLKLTFSFDPKNLSIGGAAAVSLSTALTTAGWTLSNTNLDLESGSISLDLAGNTNLTKQTDASGIELIRIAASVPYSAKFKEGEVLSVAASARSTSGSPVDVMGSSAMQKVAMIGDTDGNGNFTSNDSVVIRRLIAGISEGLSAYKSTDPNILSDLDGNSNLTSNDSVTLRRAIAGLSSSSAYSTTPYSLDLMNTNKSSVDPKIRIGTVSSAPGTTAEIPVEVYFIEDNVTGLTSYDITITYTSNTLDLLDSSKETTKQSLSSTAVIDFIPTNTSIFELDKLVSYFNETGSTGTIKLSAAVTGAYLANGAPIKPSEINESKPYILGMLKIKIPSILTAESTTPLTTTIKTATLNGIVSGSSDPVQLTTTEVTSGSVKVIEIDTTAPAFTSGTSATLNENSGTNQLVYTATATDASALTFSIKDGGDKAAIAIEASNGKVSLTANPNFESPLDSDKNNSYLFTVVATDAKGNSAEKAVTLTINDVNEPATISGDKAATGNEDVVITGTLNATDPEGLTDGTIYSIPSGKGASKGTSTIDPASGKWSYTPNANFNGSDSFTVLVTDDKSGTSEQIINLTLSAVDDPASFTGDISVTGNEDSKLSGTISATDVEGLSSSPYSIADSNKPSNGSAAIESATGKWNYTPKANYHGKDSFTVTVTDILGGTSNKAVALTINPVDDPTIITAGISGNGLKNKSISGKIVGSDIEGLTNNNIYSIIAANGATKGTATISSGSGEWTYNPRTDEIGLDSFIVTITDDAGFKVTQKVELSISSDLVKPVIKSPSTVSSINENNALDLLIYTASATDDISPSTTISYQINTPETGIFKINSETGAVSLNSSLNFEDPTDSDKNNIYEFSITAKDQAGNVSDSKSLSLTINDIKLSPTITSKNSVAINENTSGIDNQVYQATSDYPYQLTWGITGTDANYFEIGNNGKLTLAKDPSTGAIKSFPNFEEKSQYNVVVNANGTEGGPTLLPLTISINDINEPTQINGGVSGSGDEDSVISATIAATDPEGITGDNAFTITTADAPKYGTANINKLGYWTYTPKANYNSIDAFTVTITDNKGAKSSEKVNVTLKPIPDSPVITGDTSATGNKDIGNGSISNKKLIVFDPDDINGLTSVFTLSSTGKPANGAASVGNDGTWAYIPNTGYYGFDSFNIEIKDSTNQITTQGIKVIIDDSSTDQKAIITGQTSTTVDEDSNGTTGSLQALDVEGLTNSSVFKVNVNATKGIASIAPTTGNWSYKPNSNSYGNDVFTVSVTDDKGGVTLQDVTITINPIEDPGNFIKAGVKTGLMWNEAGPNVSITDTSIATDPDGTLSYSVKTSLSLNGGSISINSTTGTWSYNPKLNFTGKDSFVVVATDSFGGTTETNVAVLVDDLKTDQPTIFEGIFDVKGNEDTVITGRLTATDVDGLGANPFSIVDLDKPVNGIATVNSSDGSWSYKPNLNYNGKDSFKITVKDNAIYTSNQIISLTINPVDDPSVVTAGTKGSGFKNTDVRGKLFTSDIEGISDGSVYSIAPATGPIRGEASIDAGSGEWKYTPRNNEIGQDTFRVTITDDLGGLAYQSIDVNVFNPILPKLNGATLEGNMSITQISSNLAVQKNVDQMKSKKIELNPSMIDFTLALPVNPSKPSENNSSAAVSFNLSDVSAGLSLPSSTSAKVSSLAYYSVDNSTGAVDDFTYDPVSKTGAAFYDIDANGTPDLVTLAFIDGGRGDKDKKVNGKIVDPSTAATTDVRPLLASTDGLLIVKDSQNDAASAVVLKAQLTSRSSSVNEIGYIVLKPTETIKSLSLADLKSRSQILFAALESTDIPDMTAYKFEKSISIVNGQSIQLFESIDASLADLSKDKTSISDLGSSFKLLSSSIDTAKTSAIATSSSGISFNLKLEGSFAGLDSLIGNQQSELPILDFSSLSGKTVKADLALAREALYNSKVGFYRINSKDGSVKDLTGSIYLPGDINYKKVALSDANIVSNLNNLSVDNMKTFNTSLNIVESGLIAPYAVVNNKDTYFSFGAASDDKLSHFKVLGHNVIGFEDMSGGGDKDYDDIIIGFKSALVTV